MLMHDPPSTRTASEFSPVWALLLFSLCRSKELEGLGPERPREGQRVTGRTELRFTAARCGILEQWSWCLGDPTSGGLTG